MTVTASTTTIRIGEPTYLDTVMEKAPAEWNEDEWLTVKKAILEGTVVVTKWFPITVPIDAAPMTPFPPWQTVTITPSKWEQLYDIDRYNECAIARYFRDHPNETSVMMTCSCRFCTILCGDTTWYGTVK